MADQFVLGRADKGVQRAIGHAHCGVCGACLLFPAQLHTCPEPVRRDILEVMLEDMKPWDGGRTESQG